MTAKIVVNRGLITHGESKRMSVISMNLQAAQRDFDAALVERLLNDFDAIISKIVVSVPASWLPDGIHVGDAGWLDELSQDHYEEIMQAAQPAQPGKKTD